MAIASLICGILGLCTAGLGAIVGLILGIVALRAINRSQGQVGGKGLAIAGIVVSIVCIFLGAILIGMPVLLWLFARETSDWTKDVWEKAKENSKDSTFGGTLKEALDLPVPSIGLPQYRPAWAS